LPGLSNVRNQSLATGFDYTFSPSLLTDFRFGYMRYHVQVAPGGVGSTPATDAGIPGLNIDTLYTTGMPYFSCYDQRIAGLQFLGTPSEQTSATARFSRASINISL